MRWISLYALVGIGLVIWSLVTYFLFLNRPNMVGKIGANRSYESHIIRLRNEIDQLSLKVRDVRQENIELLNRVKEIKVRLKKKTLAPNDQIQFNPIAKPPHVESDEDVVIPVLMFACNRPTISKAIDPLLQYRGTDPRRIQKFPIIISQDCVHQETANIIRNYGEQIKFIQQPDQSEPVVPKAERKFKGYFKIARHYGWALNQTFVKMFNYKQVIIVEDDLEVSPDFFEYFEATLPVLRSDSSLWCVSAWNDNGKEVLIDKSRPDLLYRTDFFGGLGWMMTRELWVNELMIKWPKSYWDDWMRQPAQRKSRACIRPEISRTKTFGKVGVSNGLFYEKHLKYIQLNSQFYPFTHKDLTYLKRAEYDEKMTKELGSLQPIDPKQLRSIAAQADPPKAVKIFYRTKADFKSAVRVLGIMDDSKSGVPRMAYKGVVPTMYKSIRVFLSPTLNWKGYSSW